MSQHGEEKRPESDLIQRLVAGWQPARTLMAAVDLDVFTAIGDGRLTAAEVAQICSTHPRSTELLLNACVALGLLSKEGGKFRNEEPALRQLVLGKPDYIGHGIAHWDHLWWSWIRLADAVRHNRPVRVEQHSPTSAEWHRSFILAMHTRAVPTAEALADCWDLSGRRKLFDVGGGPGTYSILLCKRYPGLKAIVFDQPDSAPWAKEIIEEYGMADRVTFRAGDYLVDDFGEGNDGVLLSAILHAMDAGGCKLLLRKAYDSLVSGGQVVVQEGLIDADGTSPVRAALFSLNMLVNTDGGQSWTGEQICSWMEDIGFLDPEIRELAQPATNSLIVGTRP